MLRRLIPILFVVFVFPVTWLRAAENPVPAAEDSAIPCDRPSGTPPQPAADDTAARASAELKAKREQLSRLQAEIRDLEKQAGEFDLVMMRFRIVEVEPSSLAEVGINWEQDPEPSTCPQKLVIDNAVAARFVESLVSEKKLKVLCDSALVTRTGRPGSVQIGGEIPIPVLQTDGEPEIQWKNVGVTVRSVTHARGSGKGLIELTPNYTVADSSATVEADGVTIPGFRTWQVDARAEFEFGQTILVLMYAQPAQNVAAEDAAADADRGASARVTLLMTTPEAVTAIVP